MTLEQIFEEVRALSPAEQEQLRAMLEEAREEDEANLRERERAWRRQMEARGLLRSAGPQVAQAGRRMRDWQPIVVDGKPISETIIEERR
jgi:uncharacterized membrane protein